MKFNWRELLLGPSYLVHRFLILKSYEWTQSQVNEYYINKKRKYQQEIGGKINTKNEISRNLNKWDCRLFRFLTKTATTGGTSGSPFKFYLDVVFRRQKERAYIFDIWKDIGYRPFDLRIVIRGNISKDLIKYSVFENAYFISPSNLTPENRLRIIAFLTKLKPFFVHCYPSSLLQFIGFIGEDNFSRLKIRGILAGSEVFPKGQMEWLRTRFGIDIAHWYGHSEYAILAKYCFNCDGFHFYPTYGLAEFQRDENNDLYRIIATSYNRIGTKFLRYDTDDFAVIDDTQCDKCAFPRVASVIGRTQEYFIDKHGQIQAFGPYLFGIHGEFWTKIQAIQFIQHSPGYMKIFISGVKNGNKAWIEKFLSDRFDSVQTDFFYVDRIEKTRLMKHRYYINMLPEK